jgi:hypothetical protein
LAAPAAAAGVTAGVTAGVCASAAQARRNEASFSFVTEVGAGFCKKNKIKSKKSKKKGDRQQASLSSQRWEQSFCKKN